MRTKKKIALIILDGFGEGKPEPTNAIYAADTPYIDSLREKYPVTFLEPGGPAVGLIEGAFGSSGVGHNTIGTGTRVKQAIAVLDEAIDDGSFFQNPALLQAITHAKENDSNIHLYGIGSDSILHSYIRAIISLLDLCAQNNFPGDRVFLHLATDGRDKPQDEGINAFDFIEKEAERIGVGKIVSIIGRIYFDRGKDWKRTETLYNLYTDPDQDFITDWRAFLEEEYANDVWDQLHPPRAIGDDTGIFTRMDSKDAIVNFNFREDRARQISAAIAEDDFDGFERTKRLEDIYHVGMIPYDRSFANTAAAFDIEECSLCLSEVIEEHGYRHYHIAGKEKFIFITYNFNRSRKLDLPLETDMKAPQTKEVDTFDQNPEMSAPNLTKMLLEELEKDEQDVYFINYENCDQVGHTGDLQSAIEATEAVELSLSQVVPAMLEKGFEVLVTADHGNSDQMVNDDGTPHTFHTHNKVPFIFVSNERTPALRADDTTIADIAPTILHMMGIETPPQMTGKSLMIDG